MVFVTLKVTNTLMSQMKKKGFKAISATNTLTSVTKKKKGFMALKVINTLTSETKNKVYIAFSETDKIISDKERNILWYWKWQTLLHEWQRKKNDSIKLLNARNEGKNGLMGLTPCPLEKYSADHDRKRRRLLRFGVRRVNQLKVELNLSKTQEKSLYLWPNRSSFSVWFHFSS